MNACALALVLLLDQSASIFPTAWTAQVEGTAAALEDETVISNIENLEGGIVVQALSFSVEYEILVPWTVLKTKQDIKYFTSKLRSTEYKVGGGTYISPALDFSFYSFNQTPCEAPRKIIDVSTDGMLPIPVGIERFELNGITLNAIMVGMFQEANVEHMRNNFVSPSGFLIISQDWQDFRYAILRKLRMEIAGK